MPDRLYCYEPQRQAVLALLAGAGLTMIDGLHAVRDYHQLRGLPSGMAFAYVPNMDPSKRVPAMLTDFLRTQGFVMLSLDDSNARDLHEARRR